MYVERENGDRIKNFNKNEEKREFFNLNIYSSHKAKARYRVNLHLTCFLFDYTEIRSPIIAFLYG